MGMEPVTGCRSLSGETGDLAELDDKIASLPGSDRHLMTMRYIHLGCHLPNRGSVGYSVDRDYQIVFDIQAKRAGGLCLGLGHVDP